MKKILKLLTGRTFVVSALLFFEIVIVAAIWLFLSFLFAPLLVLFFLFNIVIVIGIINRDYDPSFKIAWLIPVMAVPVCGAVFYFMFGRRRLNKKNVEKLSAACKTADAFLTEDKELLERVREKSPHAAREALYISESCKTSLYEFTETEYFCPGAPFFERFVAELKKAKKFIFIEYFIINEGNMWETIKSILVEKQRNGVEIRVMYDDMGSIGGVPEHFPRELRKLGFKVAVFNPYRPSLDKFLNYRDHRKICSIDGKVAFTGGINIADEYIGEKTRFGEWEDSAVLLRGDAVNRMTIMFLEQWEFTTGEKTDYPQYLADFKANHDGYVIPFSGGPLTRELVCQSAYINIISTATKYVHICTPYLILDDNTMHAFIRAAKSGVDIKIITPGIPDKKYIFYMTQSNYKDLIEAGVQIYEFTPGFMHTKTLVADDEKAIVGTVNFDYRSFYLHFENGVWLYRSKAVSQAKESFDIALAKSRNVTLQDLAKTPWYKKLYCSLMKVFAPLM